MTNPNDGPGDPLSRRELAATLSAIRPDWCLVDAEPMPGGSDIVYGITVSDGENHERETVLKCFRTGGAATERTPERFLVEVPLLDLVARESRIPVPEVYGHCDSDDPPQTRAFLMERLPGESALAVPIDEESAASERFLRESGRYLARVHDCRTFETFGELVAGTDGAAVDDGHENWRDRLTAIVESALDGLDAGRFADLEPALRAYATDRLEEMSFDAESVLLHGDYRPGNLLADAETGEVTAVLDWGAAQAGDPRYELAWAVREFSQRAPVDSPVRDRARETLFDAYDNERGVAFERSGDFERRQRFYLAVTWISELGWFDAWWAGATDSVRDRRAVQLRERVASLQ